MSASVTEGEYLFIGACRNLDRFVNKAEACAVMSYKRASTYYAEAGAEGVAIH